MPPSIEMLMRTVLQDMKLKQYTIPRGSVVVISPNISHTLPECFPDPGNFQPMRFVNAVMKSDGTDLSYIAFGGGRRACKGQEFGLLQIVCAMVHMLRNY